MGKETDKNCYSIMYNMVVRRWSSANEGIYCYCCSNGLIATTIFTIEGLTCLRQQIRFSDKDDYEIPNLP